MAWAKENKSVQENNRVYKVPSIIFFNHKGEEIERLTGFILQEQFIKEINRINQGIDTYLSLKNGLKNDPNNQELIYQLAKREAKIGRKGDKNSQELWKRLIEVSESKTDKHDFARLNYYTGILWKYEKPDSLIALLDIMRNYEFKQEGFKSIVDFFQFKKDEENEKIYFKKYSDFIFRNKYDNLKAFKFLNSYALRMTEFNINFDDALNKINYVISNSPDNISNYEKAEIIYTKAEVLLKMGDNDAALDLIEQCITLLPDNEYLKEKKETILK